MSVTAPTSLTSDLLIYLHERGYVHQCTDLEGLDKLIRTEGIKAYIGFDATAASLHVGSLIQIMILRALQRFGHKPVILIGGGTTRIGDPSGKDTSRQLLDDAAIAANMKGIASVFERFMTIGDGPRDALMVNNADWLDQLAYIPMLREIGRHFTINRMLTFDSVRLRLDREQPLTFLEFNYMILQAYDFLELSRRKGVRLQIGGSDQWGNIVNGVELTRRVDGREIFGLTSPLLTTASGAKMGKTADGAIWLDEASLSAYDYYQFWRNCEDADTGRFLRLFTDLPLDEIARLEALGGAEINEAKKVLAFEATAMCHGAAAAHQAAETARKTFEQGALGDDLPSITLTTAQLEAGFSIVDALCATGLTPSKGEARRLIKGGGARLEGKSIADAETTITGIDFDGRTELRLSAGKKRHAKLLLTE